MASPIILAIFGYYSPLESNFLRTVAVLQGPALISGCIYLFYFRLSGIRRNYIILATATLLTIVVVTSGLKYWHTDWTRDGIKFFLAFCYIGFLLGFMANFSVGRVKNFISYWNIFALLLVIFILISIILFDYQVQNRFRIPGENSARTGILFFFLSFCALIYFAAIQKFICRMIYGLMFFGSSFLGLIAKSRSAIFAFLIYLFFFIFVQFFIVKLSKVQKYLLVSICLVFALTLGFSLSTVKGKNLKYRILDAVKTSKATVTFLINGNPEAYRSVNRLPLWKDALSKFKSNPIFGVGYGTQYYHEIKKEKRSHPHSIILQFLVETGIVGITLFLAFIILIIKYVIRTIRQIETQNGKQIYFFIPFVFFFFLTFASFHFAIHENYFIWYFAGMIAGFDYQ
jgi:O-antigen ligase